MRRAALACLLVLAACSREPEPANNSATIREAEIAPEPAGSPTRAPSAGEPAVPAPGSPPPTASLPEAPFAPESAQGAADVVQTFAALVEEGRSTQALRLWDRGTQAARRAVAARLARYAKVRINVGGPGAIEGAAGSRYVTVPIHLSGPLKTGGRAAEDGTATLRRVGEVDGATAEQKRWHITAIDLAPGQPRR